MIRPFNDTDMDEVLIIWIKTSITAHDFVQGNFSERADGEHAKHEPPRFQFYLSQGFQVIREQIDEHTGHEEYLMKYPAMIEAEQN